MSSLDANRRNTCVTIVAAMARNRPEDDLIRDQRKQRTREAVLDAALTLISRGMSFTGLGLR